MAGIIWVWPWFPEQVQRSALPGRLDGSAIAVQGIYPWTRIEESGVVTFRSSLRQRGRRGPGEATEVYREGCPACLFSLLQNNAENGGNQPGEWSFIFSNEKGCGFFDLTG